MSATVAFKLPRLVMTVAVLSAAAGHAAFAQCTQFQSNVVATISTVGNTVKVDPDVACVDVGGTMSWVSSDGSWTTHFPANASAFPPGKEDHQGNKGDPPHGDQVKDCKNDRKHHYKASKGGCAFTYRVTDKVGGKLRKKDPQVIIKPDSQSGS